MNRYFVGYRLKGEAINVYYFNTTAELSEKFGVINLGRRVAPHFTLKPPFETDKIEEFEIILEKLAAEQKIIPFEMEGFGKFDRNKDNVIFLESKDNPELQKAAQNIADSLKNFGQNKNLLPKPIKLHTSIARYLSDAKLEEILDYLRLQPMPKFNLKFDNLAIFKYRVGGWDIYAEFPFK